MKEIYKKRLKNYVGDDIKYFHYDLETEPYNDLVSEMLTNPNPREVVRKLQKEVFNHLDILMNFNNLDLNNLQRISLGIFNKQEIYSILKDDLFHKLIKYYNYYISNVDDDKIVLTHFNTDDATDYIKNECNNIVFALSPLKNSHKTDLFAISSGDLESELTEYVGKLKLYTGNIFKITLDNTIKVYRDEDNSIDNLYYTYDNIPNECIEYFKDISELNR